MRDKIKGQSAFRNVQRGFRNAYKYKTGAQFRFNLNATRSGSVFLLRMGRHGNLRKAIRARFVPIESKTCSKFLLLRIF